MPAAAAPPPTLFGAKDFQLDKRMLAQLAHVCTPDLPANNTSLIGDFAFSEICISEVEADKFMDVALALRSNGNAEFMEEVIARLQAHKSADVVALGDAAEAEYNRLCKVFFLRSRCIEVSRVSTEEVIGRIVSFPDQISDDYGNNLEPRSEKGMNPGKVAHAEKAAKRKGKTVFVGHGQGATVAQIVACLNDEQCVVFDGTFTSEVLVQSFFQNEMPKGNPVQPRRGEDREWNVRHYSLDIVEKRTAAAVPAALKIVAEVTQEQANKKAEEKKQKRKEEKPQGKAGADKKNGDEEKLDPAEAASEYFAKRASERISGQIPEGPAARFQQNGKFPASALSNVFSSYMASVSPSTYPYAAPESQKASPKAKA